MTKFKIGDRVRGDLGLMGTITNIDEYNRCFVLWDGNREPSLDAFKYLNLVEETQNDKV